MSTSNRDECPSGPQFDLAQESAERRGQSTAPGAVPATPHVGAEPSNTAPAKYTPPGSPDGFQFLGCGVDSLYLSYRGQLREGVRDHLTELKAFAQGGRRVRGGTGERLDLGGQYFEVLASGAKGFAFVLQNGHFHIKIAPEPGPNRPVAYVQVRSALAQAVCPLAVDTSLRKLLGELARLKGNTRVSRLDINTDFGASVNPNDWAPEAWVARADQLTVHLQKGRLSGIVVGRGGEIMARLYNKTLELGQSGHDHIHEHWTRHGWNGTDHVWRLEFQLRREALRALGVTAVSGLPDSLGPLWAHCTRDWLRLAEVNHTDSNRSRWATHTLWERLQVAPTWNTGTEALKRAPDAHRAPTDAWFSIHGLAALTSLMARDGLSDPYQAATQLVKIAYRHHTSSASRRPSALTEYLARKVASKRIRYNLPPLLNRVRGDESE